MLLAADRNSLVHFWQVVGSACGDRTTEIQNSNLFDLNAKYSDVVSEQEAVEHLRSGW